MEKKGFDGIKAYDCLCGAPSFLYSKEDLLLGSSIVDAKVM